MKVLNINNTHEELSLKNRKKWSDLLRFVYYKLAYAVKKLFALPKLHIPPIMKSPPSNQLTMDFQL